MKRVASLAVLLVLCTSTSFSDKQGLRFVSITLHDVVDTREELSADAITTDRLVALFEFLRGDGWTAISLDDVYQASRLGHPLPDRAVLITIDDGYRSLHTRVFPLLLAYRMPAVAALVGSWIETDVSRKRYISWAEAREMERSGLVEFASHTYDLHHGMLGNPQGSLLPAAGFRKYDPISGYEDEHQYRIRIREDLDKSVALMKRELGKAPRALAWPYGRYTAAADDVARDAGFTLALTLDSEPADASKPMALARYLLSADSDYKKIVSDLRALTKPPSVQRLVRLDPSTLWTADAHETEARLGRAIERVRKLGATSIVIDAALTGPDGTLSATWFPNSSLPVQADVFSRAAWQMHVRAGVRVFGRLPVKAALNTLKDPERVLALCRDFGVAAPIDGFVLTEVPQLAAMKTESGLEDETPWAVEKWRKAVEYSALNPSDALALRCFRIVEAARPQLSLALFSTDQTLAGPSSIADMTLIATPNNPKEAARLLERLKKLAGSPELFPRRLGVWIEGSKPPSSSDLIAIARMFQRNGISVIGWADDMIGDKPQAALVAGSVSASSFPVKF
ncbi:MAG TPA: poly-beta-1,6-N-acetyl-D-glucosamine N-deacetylase PgaB [Terriglobales bacterium]|jgi:biofilm PGA synthesis lipoprotein PgaB|nr:poly-beta-1,6-N-acetyl-D-glucosamine N-deacetylase PgaB [Terriglobales bacterium]